MRTDKTSISHPYRIGAVSGKAGIPVTTLRIWETRYGAFAPVKTDGGHRLYAEDDMHKAQLFKQLCAQGHAISAIAALDVSSLRSLLRPAPSAPPVAHHSPAAHPTQTPAPSTPVALAVVGHTLATRLVSDPFALALPQHAITLSDRFADLDALADASLHQQPQLLLIRASTLHEREATQIRQWLQRQAPVPVIVLYHYAPERLVHSLRRAGMVLRREPLSDFELAELIRSLLPQAAAAPTEALAASGPATAPRKYSDALLARVSALPNQMRCECPRHVAEIIGQLANFEVYSQECLNKGPQDAQLHAYLASVAGAARAMFERALEQVAAHEGIALDSLPP